MAANLGAVLSRNFGMQSHPPKVIFQGCNLVQHSKLCVLGHCAAPEDSILVFLCAALDDMQ